MRACTRQQTNHPSRLRFRLWNKRGDRVQDNDVDRAGSDNRVHDLERFFAVVRLGDVEAVHIDAQSAGIFSIERMFGIHVERESAGSLRFGNDMEGQVVLPPDSGP
jgi:hypothetical protein